MSTLSCSLSLYSERPVATVNSLLSEYAASLAVARSIAEDVTKLLQSSVAYMKNKSYLCTVFFMVLDFKVNEKGLS